MSKKVNFALALLATSAASAIGAAAIATSCGPSKSVPTDTSIDISSLIENTDIGEIEDSNEETIKTAVDIANKNKKINWNYIAIKSITPTSCRLISLSDTEYTGSVTIIFTIKDFQKTNISTLIDSKQVIEVYGDLVSVNIINTIRTNMDKSELICTNIEIIDLTTFKCKISAKPDSLMYTGQIEIYGVYAVTPKTDIATLINSNQLLEIIGVSLTENDIIKSINTAMDKSELICTDINEFGDPFHFTCKISANPTSTIYTGTVELHGDIRTHRELYLAEIITNTIIDLPNPNIPSIKEYVVQNYSFNFNEIEVDNLVIGDSSWSCDVIPAKASLYYGIVKLTCFFKSNDLSAIIPQSSYLSLYELSSTELIYTELHYMFPELIIEEIKIENLSIADHSFTVDIVPATTSRYIGISHLNGKFSSTLALNLIFNIESEKNYIYNDKPTAATIKDHIIDFYKLFANDFYVEILDNRDEPYQIWYKLVAEKSSFIYEKEVSLYSYFTEKGESK